MKIKNLFLAALAIVGVAVACQKNDEDDSLAVSTKNVEFTSAGGTQEVTITTSVSWTASAEGDWLTVKEKSGNGNATIVLTAPENPGNDRSTTLTVKAGINKARITVSQKGAQGEYVAEEGDGSAEKPYNISQIVDLITPLKWTSNTDCDKIGPFYVKGKVSEIKNQYDFGYGTANFYITDNGEDSAKKLYGYQIKYLGNKNWLDGNHELAVGDVVVINAEFMNYKNTEPETRTGGYLVSLNGITEDNNGHYPDLSGSPESTMADFIAKAEANTYYKLTGKVTTVYASTASFNFTDDEGTSVVQGYQLKNWDVWGSKVAVGSIVTMAGQYKKYQKDDSSPVTHEAVNGLILDVKEPTFDPTGVEEKTVAEFIAAANKETYYILNGTVSNFNATYFSFDLTDAAGTSIYVYSVSNKSAWADKVLNGSTVKLAGQYDYFEKDKKHEVVNAFILECTGGTEVQESEPKGEGTEASPFNAAKAKQEALKLAAGATSEQEYYIAGKVSFVKNQFDANYGTSNFYISDDGTQNVTEFYCFKVKYLGDKSWAEGDAELEVGNDVVIKAKLQNYKANNATTTTPETSGGCLISINGQKEIAPKPVFRVASKEVNAAASATSVTIKVIGNVAWTASSSDATVSPASGNGAGDVKVSFAANTDTENAKTYKVKLTTTADVEEKEIEVTITQAKAIAAGEASVVEIVIKDYAEANNWTNSTKYNKIEMDGVTVTLTGGANTGKYYTDGNNWRMYQSEKPELNIAVASGKQFVSAVVTYTVNNTGILVGKSSNTQYASGTEAPEQSFTVANTGSATNGQVRITKIAVTVQ